MNEVGTYYKVWAYLQKNYVTFFCQSELVQNLCVALVLVSIAYKATDILKDYAKKRCIKPTY